MSGSELVSVVGLTVLVAAVATLLSLPVALALGYALARDRLPFSSLIRALIALPMVMPPVAVGLCLLWLLGQSGPFAGLLHRLGIEIVFTPMAAVIAAAVVGFPLLARSAEQAFKEIEPRYEEVAATLGARPLAVFFRVTLPLARRGVLYGSMLCVTRALGEFGATAVVAGIIPGRTETLSLGIWSRIQLGDEPSAAMLVVLSFLLALTSMFTAERWLGRRP